MKNQPAIRLESVSFAYDDAEVIRSADLTVDRGEVVCVTGVSGCGKTTLLKLAAGLLVPDEGEVTLNLPLLKEDGTPNLVFVFQRGGLLSNMTAAQNLALPLLYHTSLSYGEIRERIDEALRRVGASNAAQLRPDEMTLSSRKRVALALAFLLKPSVLFLDEPCLGLDTKDVEHVCSLVREVIASTRATAIIATGDMELAEQIGHKVLTLEDGRLQNVVSNARAAEVKSLKSTKDAENETP